MKSVFRTCMGALLLVSAATTQCRAQTQATAAPSAGTLKMAGGTAFLAKLVTPIAVSKAKDDDLVEAETTQDVKQGHDVLLKKGSTLNGHVQSVQPPTADSPQVHVVIAFDRVKPKNGEGLQCNLVIQALAPESDMESRSLAEETGTGLQGATRTAGVTGHSAATRGNVNRLTLASTGVIDMQGLLLGERITEGKHYTVLASSLKDATLKKGTQLVMKAVGQ